MSLLDFDAQIKKDIGNIFLSGDFSQKAFYQKGSTIKEIDVQFFEESLDKLNTTYHHVWTDNSLIPYVSKDDTLEMCGIVYSIVDFSPDEHQNGINLFLQEV